MHRTVTAIVILALALPLGPALAEQTKSGGSEQPAELNAALSCDTGVEFNAFFQREDRRYGNVFDLGAGAQISRLEFVHFGFETLAGPYDYDVEFWDDATCTKLGEVTGLVAADAFGQSMTESVDLCALNLTFAGMVAVVIHAKSCADAPANTDCYPDLMFDPNLAALCPRVITPATPTCAKPINGGAFLLRIDVDSCPTPVKRGSWGMVKIVYR